MESRYHLIISETPRRVTGVNWRVTNFKYRTVSKLGKEPVYSPAISLPRNED